ncbi:MAG: hypothetical protein U0002_15625 [Thermoanaerobaculia bacterium]
MIPGSLSRTATPREIRLFGLLLILLGAGLAFWVATKPRSLVVPALLLALGWLGSLLARGEHRAEASRGTLLPLALGSVAGLSALGVPGPVLGALVGLACLAGGLGCLVSLDFGSALRFGWLRASEPMGWTVSHLVLGLVYFGLLTPIGWLLRRFRPDPLKQRLDRSAKSYWVEHKTPSDLERYFRQY